MTKETITAIIAGYGAALSTIIAITNWRRDRAEVKLVVKRNHQIIGNPPYQAFALRGKTLVAMQVTNVGRRPVTIMSVGAIGLYPNDNYFFTDTQPPLPCEITEGKPIESFLPQPDIDFSTIDYWYAWDSHGRYHKAREASLFKHWKSEFQLWRSKPPDKSRQDSI